MKLKKGDKVIVTTGKDKGTVGIIRELFPRTHKIVVEGINFKTKHIKPSQENPEGGIEKFEAPISSSNVMLVISDKKDEIIASKTGYKIEENKKGKKDKVRFAKKTGDNV
jgi:large subunit ribosomal protein L24